MPHLSIVIAIVAISVMILLGIVSLNKVTRWVSFIIIPFLSFAVYIGWEASEDLLGYPAHKLPNTEWMLLGAALDPDKAIYVLVQSSDKDSVPVYVKLRWSKEKAQNISQALEAICQGKTVMGNGRRPGKEGGKEGNYTGDRDDGSDEEILLYEFDIKTRMPKK